MWLNDLEELVGKLRDRIHDHRGVLAKSESTTRYALVNPLLAGLGWDLANPDQVLTEYEASYEGDDKRHYADYVLLHVKRPCLVIEAKSFGTKLATGDAIDQGTKYCNRLGIQYFVLTDGGQWQAREKADPRNPVFEFDVTDPEQASSSCFGSGPETSKANGLGPYPRRSHPRRRGKRKPSQTAPRLRLSRLECHSPT